MRTPTRLRDTGFRLTSTTVTSPSAPPTVVVALSLTAPMTPPTLAGPASVVQPVPR
jgi:hypothetical protein